LIAVFQDKEYHTSGLEHIINLYDIVMLESPHEIDFVGDKLFDFFFSNHLQIEQLNSIHNSILFGFKHLSKWSFPKDFIDFISIDNSWELICFFRLLISWRLWITIRLLFSIYCRSCYSLFHHTLCLVFCKNYFNFTLFSPKRK